MYMRFLIKKMLFLSRDKNYNCIISIKLIEIPLLLCLFYFNSYNIFQMIVKEQQKSLNISQNPEFQDIIHENQDQKTSKHTQEYKQFSDSTRNIPISELHQNLKEHNIRFDRNKFFPELNIYALSYTRNFQIIRFSVSFSHFNFEINMLNVEDQSMSQTYLQNCGKGAFGTIYKFHYKHKKNIAIKSIKYQNQISHIFKDIYQIQNKSLRQAIFQCCLNKLFSALQIGPKFSYCFGFDLIVYADRIEFALEFCDPLTQQNINFQDLMSSLKMMHQLHIVHGDIKPENIMWSPTFQKMVFVDFGLSKVIKQNIGLTTLTSYFGTYEYSCMQMKQLFTQKGLKNINLYSNDLYALKLVMKQQRLYAKQQKHQKQKKSVIINQLQYQTTVQKKLLKYLIFQLNYQKIDFYLTNNIIKKVDTDDLKVFFILPKNKEYKDLFIFLYKIMQLDQISLFQSLIKFYENQQITDNKVQQIINKCRNIFKQRNIQVLKSNEMVQNQTINFIKVCFNQDISLNKKKQQQKFKNLQLNQLIKYKKQQYDKQFWFNISSFVNNVYTTNRQIKQLFKILKKILNINVWKYQLDKVTFSRYLIKNKKDFEILQLFLQAKQIKQQVLKQYKIDFYKISLRRGIQQINLIYYYNYHSKPAYQNQLRKLIENIQPQQFYSNQKGPLIYKILVQTLVDVNYEENFQDKLQNIRKDLKQIQEEQVGQKISQFLFCIYCIKFLSTKKQCIKLQFCQLVQFLNKNLMAKKSWPYICLVFSLAFQIHAFSLLSKDFQNMFVNYCFNNTVLVGILVYKLVYVLVLEDLNEITFEQLKINLEYISSLFYSGSQYHDYIVFNKLLLKICIYQLQINHQRCNEFWPKFKALIVEQMLNIMTKSQKSQLYKQQIQSQQNYLFFNFYVENYSKIKNYLTKQVEMILNHKILTQCNLYSNQLYKQKTLDFLELQLNLISQKQLAQKINKKFENSKYEAYFFCNIYIRFNYTFKEVSAQKFYKKLVQFLQKPNTDRQNLLLKKDHSQILSLIIQYYVKNYQTDPKYYNKMALRTVNLVIYLVKYIDSNKIDLIDWVRLYNLCESCVFSYLFIKKQQLQYQNVQQLRFRLNRYIYQYVKNQYEKRTLTSFKPLANYFIFIQITIRTIISKYGFRDRRNQLKIIHTLKFLLKLTLMLVFDSFHLYRRNFNNQYSLIILQALHKEIVQPSFFIRNPKHTTKNAQKQLKRRLHFLKFRSHYPLSESEIKLILKKMTSKAKQNPKSYQKYSKVLACFKIQGKVIQNNNNKLSIYEPSLKNQIYIFLFNFGIVNLDQSSFLLKVLGLWN